MKQSISKNTIKKIAQLSHLPITDNQINPLQTAFADVIDVFANLQELDVSQTEPTSQVTGQENVLREDIVDEQRMLPQKLALQSARKTHAGFFVAERLIDEN